MVFFPNDTYIIQIEPITTIYIFIQSDFLSISPPILFLIVNLFKL